MARQVLARRFARCAASLWQTARQRVRRGSDAIIAPSLMSEDILLRLKPDSPDQGSGEPLKLQSSRVGACLEGTMSASGDLPSIGAPTAGGECPDVSGETLVRCLQAL